MITVAWLQPFNQWDTNTFELLLRNELWQPVGSYEFEHHHISSTSDLPDAEGIILIVPHKYYVDKTDWLNQQMSKYKWVLYIGTGNEEAEFPLEKIKHPNMIIYYTTPHMKRTPLKLIKRYFGDGYPQNARVISKYQKQAFEKPLDVFFGGQVTHERREQAMKAVHHMRDEMKLKVDTVESQGFTQGVEPADYYKLMASAKVVPCPAGTNTPDTFRSYEALECMAYPIVDTRTIYDEEPLKYWQTLFGEEPPFSFITDDWESLPGYTQDVLADWHTHINRAVSWWIGKKRQYAYELVEDLTELTGQPPEMKLSDKITVLVVTSPIKSHPETKIIDRTIADIRAVLPDCEIIIGIDGVRQEQESYTDRYNEYKQRLLWKCLHEWHNVLPVVFNEHKHQAAMVKHLLTLVNTETILFVEHDTALAPEFEYPWQQFIDAIEKGEAYTIRFSHEANILEPHKHLMVGEVEEVEGVPMLRTAQWSQRPHLSSTAFYRDMIDRYFTDQSRTMIEDKVHGYPAIAWQEEGLQGWYKWRLWIYHPTDGNIKRSYTSDGREDDPKYEMVF